MSRAEYDNTVADLLGDRSRPGSAKLPEARLTPEIAFENDITLQDASAPLIAAASTRPGMSTASVTLCWLESLCIRSTNSIRCCAQEGR